MRKLEALSAWLFFCLGVVFLGVSILVVPQRAFAQGGASCTSVCCSGCFSEPTCSESGSCYTTCYAGCTQCVSYCNGDQGCIDNCYAGWYSNPSGTNMCLGAACYQGITGCIVDPCTNSNSGCNKLGPLSCGACICQIEPGFTNCYCAP